MPGSEAPLAWDRPLAWDKRRAAMRELGLSNHWPVCNIMSNDYVRESEADPLFVGWCVCGKRPMAASKCFDGALAYGNAGTIFPTYNEALEAVVKTAAYAQRNGYDWDGGLGWCVFDLKMAAAEESNTDVGK